MQKTKDHFNADYDEALKLPDREENDSDFIFPLTPQDVNDTLQHWQKSHE